MTELTITKEPGTDEAPLKVWRMAQGGQVTGRPATDAELKDWEKTVSETDWESLSPARRLLLKAGGGKNVKPQAVVIFDGEEFEETVFVRRIDANAQQEISSMCYRHESGTLDLISTEGHRSYHAALLFCLVMVDETGDIKFFAPFSEAWEWVTDQNPIVRRAVDRLLKTIYEMNPDMFGKPVEPTSQEKSAAEELEKKDDSVG